MVKGEDFERAYTLKSMYDNDSIALWHKSGVAYRIQTSELLKLIKKAKFKTETKKVHTYLEVVS